MDIPFLILIVSALSGIICISLGFLITVKKKYELINGVDFTALKEPEKFATFVGHSILLTGVLMMLLGFLVFQEFMGIYVFLMLIVVFSIIPLPAFFFAKSKYLK
ncbi:hypothetical protein [Paraglaciecola sp. 2405UD69-4]|uniref:hypothetical protein n=1 Tax=Paraglaciecola sp. 2405UD69-4 TaxID=3391836 RepID=UPI0039C8CA20